MRLGGRGLGGTGRVGGGEMYTERAAGGSALLLAGQERVAGGVLVACYVGSHPGTQESGQEKHSNSPADVIIVTDTSGCRVTDAYLEKAPKLASKIVRAELHEPN